LERIKKNPYDEIRMEIDTNKSENQAMTVCIRQTFYLLNITKGKSYWYCGAICTRTLAGNLSLWSVTANAISQLLATMEADAVNQE
jgi:hypothetical protein